MSDFDTDLVRLEQIRRSHESARPTPENPAWVNTHGDLSFVLSFLDKLHWEYRRTLADADRFQETLTLISDGHTPPEVAADAARASLHRGCGKCCGTGRVTDTEGQSWPCYA